MGWKLIMREEWAESRTTRRYPERGWGGRRGVGLTKGRLHSQGQQHNVRILDRLRNGNIDLKPY